MKDIIKTGIVLLIIGAVAAVALGLTNEFTYDKIQEQRRIASEQARIAVLPTANTFASATEDEISKISSQFEIVSEAYVGLDASGNVVGYVIKSTPSGFSGEVEVVTGVSLDGLVTGLRVGTHNETPGLGAKATDAAFFDQYTGLSTEAEIGVSKTPASGNDIQAITGATITSAAVTDGANISIQAVKWIVENGGIGN